ncbi:MAG: SGNH/GDSL hydrolase family protein [Methylobacteriaceae bacterium]|nr:SGNH/GDSL hydrolase family protein [Methylobacteriaceae bacterium]
MAAPAEASDPSCPTIKSIFSTNGAWQKPEAAGSSPISILAIGSSSTAGVGASAPNFAYPAQLRLHLAALWGMAADVVNAGIGGETVSTTVERLEAALRTGRPDLVIWQVGTNDAVGREDEDHFRNLVQGGISAVRDAGIDLVLLDPQFFPTIRNPQRYEGFVRTIAELGVKNNVPVFSRYALMKALGERSPDELRAQLAKDGFHMSDHGYDCLARSLAAEIAHHWGRTGPVAAQPEATPKSAAVLGKPLSVNLQPSPGASPQNAPPPAGPKAGAT